MKSLVAAHGLQLAVFDIDGTLRRERDPYHLIFKTLGLINDFGFKEIISNELVFNGQICTGEIKINVRDGQKGEILSRKLKEYGIGPEHVVAFGDSSSDIPMLELAGLGVAVFPTSDAVKMAADLVIERDEDWLI